MSSNQQNSPLPLPADVNGVHPQRYAASYERKSTSDEQGIQQQYMINKQRAEQEGYTIPDDPQYRFSDDATTGVAHRRSGFDLLMKMVGRGDVPFERVYAKDRTRFGRWEDAERHGYWFCYLKDRGVDLRFTNEGEARDAGTSMKAAVENILASEERNKLKERVRVGQRHRVLQGFYPGGREPYGTTRWLALKNGSGDVQAVSRGTRINRPDCSFRLRYSDDGTKEVVRDIFIWYEQGASFYGIAKRLNDAGVKGPTMGTRSGKPLDDKWSNWNVKLILKNPIYVGDLVWGRNSAPQAEAVSADQVQLDGDDPIIYRDFMLDAPVPRERWEAVQRLRHANRDVNTRRRASKPIFLVSGVLRCQNCGGKLWGSSHRVGTDYRYYRHDPSGGGGGSPDCPFKKTNVRAAQIEPAVEETIRSLLSDDRLRQLAASEIHEHLNDEGAQRRLHDLGRLKLEQHRTSRAADEAGNNMAHSKSPEERQVHNRVVASLVERLRGLSDQIMNVEIECERLAKLRARLESDQTRRQHLVEAFDSTDDAKRKVAMRILLQDVLLNFDTLTLELRVRAVA